MIYRDRDGEIERNEEYRDEFITYFKSLSPYSTDFKNILFVLKNRDNIHNLRKITLSFLNTPKF